MLVRRWLDEAGIHDPLLRESYMSCLRGAATRDAGRTRWWALRSVPAAARPHVAAFVELAFRADVYADTGPPQDRLRHLDAYAEAALAAVAEGGSADPVLCAVAHSVNSRGLPAPALEGMFAAMRRDAVFSAFDTYEELLAWATQMTGGPTVGMAMLVADPGAVRGAEGTLRELGAMAQLVDAFCDLAEDLADDRLYLPLEDLDRFGVRAEDFEARRWTPPMAELIAFEADRVRARLPVLAAEVQRELDSPLGRAVGEYCALQLDAVVAAGAGVLERPVRPPLAHVTAVWQPMWRSVIPC